MHDRRGVNGSAIALCGFKFDFGGSSDRSFVQSVAEATHNPIDVQFAIGGKHDLQQDLAFQVQLTGLIGVLRRWLRNDFNRERVPHVFIQIAFRRVGCNLLRREARCLHSLGVPAAVTLTRLRNAVYVTYPYAKRAGAVMNDINTKIAKMQEKEDRKAYIKTREKELRKEFTEPLTNLSIYQGKVLMKLINRQTGNNCYEIIKEYKGGLVARFYQTVAFFFDSNLKQPYDASGDDAEIEKIDPNAFVVMNSIKDTKGGMIKKRAFDNH